jgi:hypothetical protein
MKNIGWYIIVIFMGLLDLIVTINTNFFPGTISPFGYIGIFMIILGLWGILAGILNKEVMSQTTFFLMVLSTVGVVLFLSLFGI